MPETENEAEKEKSTHGGLGLIPWVLDIEG